LKYQGVNEFRELRSLEIFAGTCDLLILSAGRFSSLQKAQANNSIIPNIDHSFLSFVRLQFLSLAQ
jgi:hypothetical protein